MSKEKKSTQDDYDLKPVDQSVRQGSLSLSFIFMAWFCTLNFALVGAAVGSVTRHSTAVWACIVACIILLVLGIVLGAIGQRTGLGTGMLCRFSFGIKGAKVPTALAAVAMWGWMCFDMWTGAAVVMALFNAAGWNPIIGWILGAAILAAVAILGAIKGITGVAWISWVTTPIAIVLFVILIIASINAAGGLEAINNFQPPTEVPFLIAVNIALGSWINGTTLANDMTRTAKSFKAVVWATIAGVLMGFVLLYLGVVGFQGMGAYGIAAIGVALAGGLFYVTEFFTLIAMGNTVPGTDYVIATNWSSVFNKGRKVFCIIIPLVGIGIGALLEFSWGIETVQTFLNYLSVGMPPIIGVMLADYWVVNKGKYGSHEEIKTKWSVAALLALAIGIAVSAVFTFALATGLPALFGIIASFGFYILFKLCFKMK